MDDGRNGGWEAPEGVDDEGEALELVEVQTPAPPPSPPEAAYAAAVSAALDAGEEAEEENGLQPQQQPQQPGIYRRRRRKQQQQQQQQQQQNQAPHLGPVDGRPPGLRLAPGVAPVADFTPMFCNVSAVAVSPAVFLRGPLFSVTTCPQ